MFLENQSVVPYIGSILSEDTRSVNTKMYTNQASGTTVAAHNYPFQLSPMLSKNDFDMMAGVSDKSLLGSSILTSLLT